MSIYNKLVGATAEGELPPAVIAPLDRAYRRGLSVREYGAVGDGTTDDTAAIQTVLNAAQPGDTVHLPAGTYAVAGIAIPERVALNGGGQARLRFRNGSNTLLIHLVGKEAQLSGLSIDGNSANQTSTVSKTHAVLVSGESCRVSDIHMEDVNNIGVGIAPEARHAKIERVTIARSGGTGLPRDCTGFDIKSSYATISGCHVYDHGNGHAFRIANTVEAPPEFVTIENCVVERSQHNAFTLEIAAAYVTIANCLARDVPQAVKGDGSAHHITVIGCIFERITLSTAFNMGTVAYTVVSGTQLKDSAGWISVGPNSTVTGCTLQNIGIGATGLMYGVYIRSGVVAGNVFNNVDGQVIRVIDGANIQNNRFVDCGKPEERHLINAGSAPGVNISGNTFVNPQNTSAPESTLIFVDGLRAVIQGNVLDGTVTRGVWMGVNASQYIVTGNVLTGATTAVFEHGSPSSRIVTNNL